MTRAEALDWVDQRQETVLVTWRGRRVSLRSVPLVHREAEIVRITRALERGEVPKREGNGWAL